MLRPRRSGAGEGGRARRSRGGLSSKIDAAVDAARLPLAFALTPGQAADSPRFQTVLDRVRVSGPTGRPRTRPGAVAADKAYQRPSGSASHLTLGRPAAYRNLRQNSPGALDQRQRRVLGITRYEDIKFIGSRPHLFSSAKWH